MSDLHHDRDTLPATGARDRDQVRALELRLLDPQVRADPSQARALLHPDFVEFGASGRVWDRASVLAALAADSDARPVVTDVRVEAPAADVLLVTYRSRRAGRHGTRESLRSSLWIRDEHGWRVRFHQGTPVPR